jgi:hypothetical protein
MLPDYLGSADGAGRRWLVQNRHMWAFVARGVVRRPPRWWRGLF